MKNKYITEECAELLKELHTDMGSVKEAISWLKKAVMGIYGGLGLFIAQQAIAFILK